MRLTDTDRAVLEILWHRGPTPAAELAVRLQRSMGWSKTTTYTMVGRLVKKRLVHREEPGYICTAALTQTQAAEEETRTLLHNYYQDSPEALMEALRQMTGAGK